MEKNYIELTIKTPDGDIQRRKVRGLVYIAQSIKNSDATMCGTVGTGGNLAKTMSQLDGAVRRLKKRFIEQFVNQHPKVAEKVAEDMKDFISSLSSKNPEMGKKLSALARSSRPLTRQKVVN